MAPEEILDFSASINPLGLPPGLEEVLRENLFALAHYPDPECGALREELACRYGLAPENVLVGNGSNELIHLIPRALRPRRGLIPVPNFSEYEKALSLSGCQVIHSELTEGEGFRLSLRSLGRDFHHPPENASSPQGSPRERGLSRGIRTDPERAGLLFLGNPHNPSGALISREALRELLEASREAGTHVVVDEAFIDFLEKPEEQSLASEVEAWDRLLVLRSFTKFYAIPGLRLGYLLGSKALVARIRPFKEPWTVNALAQAVGLELCRNPRHIAYAQETRRMIAEERGFLTRSLREIGGLEVFPSQVNFLLVRVVAPEIDASTLVRRAAERKVLVRDCAVWRGLGPAYFRVAVRTRPENLQLIEALGEIVRGHPGRPCGAETGPGVSSESRQRVLDKVKAGLVALLSPAEGPGDPGKAENENSYPINLNCPITHLSHDDIGSGHGGQASPSPEPGEAISNRQALRPGSGQALRPGSGQGQAELAAPQHQNGPVLSKVEGLPKDPDIFAGEKGGREARTLMVLGTGSHVGKSLLVAALCRIFWQDGYRVAPFKAQNMALNSFVTREGGEIGRAQAVQAQACGIEPTVEMNPILLKPTTEVGAQVIVRGRPIGHMRTDEYIAFKPRAFEVIRESLECLREAYDLVVLEGAGSPAEVNLKAHDIVNLRMAEAADAPAILVGDIDRGGVFAWLLGTLELLEEGERERIAGLVINKFRGDLSLLQPGLDFLEARTGLPVLGVIPYLSGLKVAQEDSLGIPEAEANLTDKAGEIVIRVIRLPHISNFTDFDPLGGEPDVALRYISEPQEIGEADLLILPGSKNTLADLAFLKERGFAPAIRRCRERGGRVIGICGGFQMLGRRILDPLGVESPQGEMEGLGLLAATTRFEDEKVTVRARAIHLETGTEVSGYEIHMGRTWAEGGARPVFRVTWRAEQEDEGPEGLSNDEGTVWGTYLHGLFDQAPFRRAFLNGLRRRKGLGPLEGQTGSWDPTRELDRLADCVRQSLDIPAIYRLMGL